MRFCVSNSEESERLGESIVEDQARANGQLAVQPEHR